MTKEEQAKQHLEFLTAIKTQVCGLAQAYEGPLKELVSELQGKLDKALAALPADGTRNWAAEEMLGCLTGALVSATAVCSTLTAELQRAKGLMAGPEIFDAEIAKRIAAGTLMEPSAVEAEVQKRITAGALVAKEMVDGLCATARTEGNAEGRQQLQAEMDAKAAADRLATERRESLTQAGIVVDEKHAEAVLRLPQEAFDTARAKYEARRKELSDAGVAVDSMPPNLMGKLWGGDEAFVEFAETAKGLASLKKIPPSAPNLLAGGAPAPEPRKKAAYA